MSRKEIDRLSILTKVQECSLTQVKAAEILNISIRQVRNLLSSLKAAGPQGIISKARGKGSNRSIDPSLKSLILRIIYEKYEDFGPTLVAEKLLEFENLTVSRETLRKWMVETHLWIPKVKKRIIHPLRKCREYFGEMLQGDRSHHDWFENGKPCVLLFFIDDATNRITAARFEETESFFMKNQELKCKKLDEVYDNKVIKLVWPVKNRHSHRNNHPWKDYSYNRHLKEKAIKEYNS